MPDTDALGNRMKLYEMAEAGRKLLPLLPVMARIDGRCFSRFTQGLKRPYDRDLSELMIDTTKYLVQETNASMGYTQSDEITLTWYTDSLQSEIFFNGRIQKMTSVLASMTTVYFLYRLPYHLPSVYAEKLPHFDARVWQVPTLMEGVNCFLWREQDATKNSIQMAAQHYYSHKQLQGLHSDELQELLHQKGINWNDYPAFFKRGSYIQRRKSLRRFAAKELEKLPPLHEARNNPELLVERTDYLRVNIPPLGKISNRISVIYQGTEPVTSQEKEC